MKNYFFNNKMELHKGIHHELMGDTFYNEFGEVIVPRDKYYFNDVKREVCKTKSGHTYFINYCESILDIKHK